jgi:hypothetical protein
MRTTVEHTKDVHGFDDMAAIFWRLGNRAVGTLEANELTGRISHLIWAVSDLRSQLGLQPTTSFHDKQGET